MHERALVSKTAIELASVTALDRVSHVTLALSPETDAAVVEEAWRAVTSGTPVATATLTCVTRDHVLQCLECGVEYVGDKLSPCHSCGGNGLIVGPTPEVALHDWVIEEAL
jgi:Zn finger protein HypA/HybF involved in hydrogenase expression